MRSLTRAAATFTLGFLLVGALHPNAGAAAQAKPEASHVRVLLLLDTQAQGGETWGLDGDNMRALLEHCVQRQGLQSKVTIDHFTGSDARAAQVLDYYDKLKTGPGETLLFYYSGHGGYHGKKGHFMALTGGNLYRNELLAAMNKNRPRLRVVLTDCCANLAEGAWQSEPPGAREESIPIFGVDLQEKARRAEPPGVVVLEPKTTVTPKSAGPGTKKKVGAEQPKKAKLEEPPHQEDTSGEGYPGGTSPVKAKKQEPPVQFSRGVALLSPGGSLPMDDVLRKVDGSLMRGLLFRQTGLVDINGCKVGLLSMGLTEWGGSVFTNSFIFLQAEPPAKTGGVNVSWESFFAPWRLTTERLARAYTKNMSSQSPQAFSLGNR
jgi:hypothetical protein